MLKKEKHREDIIRDKHIEVFLSLYNIEDKRSAREILTCFYELGYFWGRAAKACEIKGIKEK